MSSTDFWARSLYVKQLNQDQLLTLHSIEKELGHRYLPFEIREYFNLDPHRPLSNREREMLDYILRPIIFAKREPDEQPEQYDETWYDCKQLHKWDFELHKLKDFWKWQGANKEVSLSDEIQDIEKKKKEYPVKKKEAENILKQIGFTE